MPQVFERRCGQVILGRAEEVYPTLEGVRLIISDGPYGMNKADWDRVRDLAAWYRPHVEAWSRSCLPCASVYFWNSFTGVLAVQPEFARYGWTLKGAITWNKGFGFVAGRIDTGSLRSWMDVTEVCAVYQRESIDERDPIEAAGASERNTIRLWLCEERVRAGMTGYHLKAAITEEGAKGEMITRHSFSTSQWCMPTFDQWSALHRAWNKHGRPEGRPYLQRAEQSRVWDQALRADYEALRADYEALRADYEALRVPFSHPLGVTNVWDHPMVQGPERLRDANKKPLHPCQKPLLFSRRMIEASTRPGDLVFEPFGGTCRAAFACEELGDRRYICSEIGEEYVRAVVALLPKPARFDGKQALLWR